MSTSIKISPFLLPDGNINPGSLDGTGRVRVASTGITQPSFSGTGLNDLTSGGTYTGSILKVIDVKISATGSPNSFQWRVNGGAYSSNVSITGAAQTLVDGVTITFGATTGHTLNDVWTFQADVTTNSIGFNSITPDKNNSVFAQELRFNSILNSSVITDVNSNALFSINPYGLDDFEFTTAGSLGDVSEAYLFYANNLVWMSYGDHSSISGGTGIRFLDINGQRVTTITTQKSGDISQSVGFFQGNNQTTAFSLQNNFATRPVAIAARNFTINSGIDNAVILGGVNQVADKNDAAFAQELRFKSSTDTLISQIGNTAGIQGNYAAGYTPNSIYLSTSGDINAGGSSIGVENNTSYKGLFAAAQGQLFVSVNNLAGTKGYLINSEPDSSWVYRIADYESGVGNTEAFVIAKENYTTANNRNIANIGVSTRNTALNATTYFNSAFIGGNGGTINKSNYAFAKNLEVQGGTLNLTAESKIVFDSSGTNKVFMQRADGSADTTFYDDSSYFAITDDGDGVSFNKSWIYFNKSANELEMGRGIGASLISFKATGNEVQMVAGTGGNAAKIRVSSVGIGFNNTSPIAKPTITGVVYSGSASDNLLAQLSNYGLITDSSTAEQYQSKSTTDTLSATTGTIDMDANPLSDGGYKKVTATGNIILNATTAESTTISKRWTLEFTQNGVGGHTLTLGTNFLTPGGVAPVVSSGIGQTDTLLFETDSAGKHRLIDHRKSYA